MLSTVVIMLYIRSLEHTHLIAQSVYPLPLFILTPRPWKPYFYSFTMSFTFSSLFFFFNFMISQMNKTVRNVSLANFTLHHVFKV